MRRVLPERISKVTETNYRAALQEMVDAYVELLSLEGWVSAGVKVDDDDEYHRVLTLAERRMKLAVEQACKLLDMTAGPR